MNNPRFNVGDEVVALVSNTGNPYQQKIKKDDLYTVNKTIYCQGCGKQWINVGQQVVGSNITEIECRCKSVQNHNGFYWTYSIYFALILNMTAQIEEALEEPIEINNI